MYTAWARVSRRVHGVHADHPTPQVDRVTVITLAYQAVAVHNDHRVHR